MSRFIYADNAATTKISDNVLAAMMPYIKEEYGNASSVYRLGRESKKAIEAAREKTAAAIGANPAEIYFTSGGSESDNWALKSFGRALAKKGKNHIITTAFEHHAILHSVEALKKEGFEVTFLDVNKHGLVEPEALKKAIRPETGLVSVIYVNNEIGTIQPIAELGKICRDAGVLFHTDAVQAIGKVEVDVAKQNIDLLSLTAHKIHGPKGVGALYVRKGLPVAPYIDGGAQERGKRAGTENTAGIVGLGAAMEEACRDIAGRNQKLLRIRDMLIDGLLTVKHSRLNGDREKRISSNVNISFAGVEGESLLLMLDFAGIAASSGSACTSGSLDPSHVLLAIGLIHEVAHGSLRLSISDETTEDDAEYIIENTKSIVDKLRKMSPMWEKIESDPDYKVD